MPFVDRDQESLDWPEILEVVAQGAQSAPGLAACRALDFLPTVAQAQARMQAVWTLVCRYGREQRWPVLSFPEVQAVLDAASRGAALGADELKTLADFCQTGENARRFFKDSGSQIDGGSPPDGRQGGGDDGGISALASRLGSYPELLRRARETFDAAGEIRDSASPELARLRRERDLLAERTRSQVESLLNSEIFEPVLQDRYVTIRQERFVLPIKASFKSMGLGIVHDSSRTGETVFLEPAQMVESNNRLKVAGLGIRRECRRILEELAHLVAIHVDELREDLAVLCELDRLTAMARYAVACDAVPVQIESSATLRAENLRHPLLVWRARKEKFGVVGNDVALGGDDPHALVVSGPNAGGKTVLLKSVGLAVLSARAGLPVVAAAGAKVGFFSDVLVDVGDQQSVLGDLSTFSAHLENVARIGQAAREAQRFGRGAALVLCDELMAGTNPEQGAALARAVLEDLVDADTVLVTTTHYDSLKALADGDRRFANAGMEYDMNNLRPTYRMKVGQPGRSFALDIAAIMGLPQNVLERAGSLVGGASAGLETVLRQLEIREAALAQAEESLQDARDELQVRVGQEKQATAKLAERERKLARMTQEQIAASVSETRQALRDIVRDARKEARDRHPLAVVAKAQGEVNKAAEQAAATMPSYEPVAAFDINKLREALASRALGVSSGGSAIHTNVRKVKAAPKPKPVKRPHGDGDGAQEEIFVRTASNTLDIRGRRADEGLSALDNFLDDNALAGSDCVFVIHGHGTGALRKAVREFLAVSPYVSRQRAGEMEEGGDGVSVAILKG